ncbi:MAG: rpiB [Candidatus Saccharibacteria bacterium]|nr:rpiB [Candidatus Saccharibacteria bacterium]
MMKIYLGADHNGFEYKQQIADFLRRSGHEIIDSGDAALEPGDDFPQFAGKVAHGILTDNDQQARGILICGSGQGMCMAANRFKGIRASLCWNLAEAHSSRNDDNGNVLCLSAKQLDMPTTQAIITTWLETPFAAADRYVRRLKQLDELT